MIWKTICFLSVVALLDVPEIFAQKTDFEFSLSYDHAHVSVYDLPKPDSYISELVRFSRVGGQISAAKGTVSIPNNKWVGVEVDYANGCNAFVASLPKHGFNRLELRGAKVTTDLIAAIERIESLSELHFIDCSFESLDADQLQGLRRLQSLPF